MQLPPSVQPTFLDRLIRPARDAMAAALSRPKKRNILHAQLPGSPERREGDRRKDERRRDEAVLLDAQGSLRAGNPNRSLRVLVEWLDSRGDQAEDFAWLCSRIASWDDERLINHLIQARVARLLTLERNDELLALLVERLTSDRTFRPKTAAVTLTVAHLAANRGHFRVSLTLLSDFAARFKGDARIPAAYALKQNLSVSGARKGKSA